MNYYLESNGKTEIVIEKEVLLYKIEQLKELKLNYQVKMYRWSMVTDIMVLSAAIAVAGCGIGAAYAEAHVGAAAVGASSENEKNFSKGLIMTVIPETIAVFGLVIALIILFVV